MCSFNGYSLKEIIRLRSEINRLLGNVFNSTKEIKRWRKEINRLLSKRNAKYLLKTYYSDVLQTSNIRVAKLLVATQKGVMTF